MLKKRILSVIVVIIALLGFCLFAWQKFGKKPKAVIHVTEETIAVPGLKKEYKFYFLADSHICITDERDSGEVIAKESNRREMFSHEGLYSEDYFDALMDEAAVREEDIVILGGDIIDSAMYASIEHVSEQIAKQDTPVLYYSGNHDFEYGSEYYTENAFRIYRPRLAQSYGSAQSYQVKEYEDLIIFTADDWGNRISEEALEAFRAELKKGKPMVVCVHVPFEPVTGDTGLAEDCKAQWGPSDDGHSRVTIGPNGCYPDESTMEFINLLTKKDSPVVLVLAGHIHAYHKDMLNEGVTQIVTGAAFEGNALEVTLRPE